MKKYDQIYSLYKELFRARYNANPIINYGQCGKLIESVLEDIDEDTILTVIKMYFEQEPQKDTVFHLPVIISAYTLNKYLQKLNSKVDKDLYTTAEEHL